MNKTLTIALAQLASNAAVEQNLETAAAILERLRGRCDLAVFPENVLCLGRGKTVRAAARTMPDLFALLGGLCRRHETAAVFGGVPVADATSIANASLAFGPDGTLLARYDKMHLFQLDPDKPGGVDETRIYCGGPGPIAFEYLGWKIGLSICYDLRFPELYRTCAPCDLLLCTAAFTKTTGQAHWEILTRARAIENLCYFAAVGQCGKNEETGLEYFGNSLVAEPWGEVIARVEGRKTGIALASLDKERIAACRHRLPALRHRRLRHLDQRPERRHED